jgi:UDP-glucose 4-epimerase
MTTIAVTGSSGFIGTHLVNKLKELNNNIIKLDRSNGVDLTNWEKVQFINKFDLLFHLAAKSYVPDSYNYPREYYDTNILTTLNALELCRIHQAKMIFISSYVYGVPKYLPIDEEHPITAFNPYAQTKIIGEQICQGYSRDFGLKVIVLRPFNIYGVGQNSNFIIPTIINQVKSGKIKLNDPNPKRDMIYIDDVIELFLKVINYDSKYDVFNIGSGKSYSIKEITDIICGIYNENITVEYFDLKRKIEVMETRADITKAKKLLGWSPKIDIEQGLKRIIDKIQ